MMRNERVDKRNGQAVGTAERRSMNEERNRRIRRFLEQYINSGTKNIYEDALICAVQMLIERDVFTFAELQRECALEVRAIIPADWAGGTE